MDRLLKMVGLVRLSTIKELLNETKTYHITNNKLSDEYDEKQFYFDCGADSAINHIGSALGIYKFELRKGKKNEL